VDRAPEAGRSDPALGWPFVAWSLPWWYFVFGLGWWRVSAHQLADLAPRTPGFAMVAPGAAVLAVLARMAGVLIETSFYVAWWRTRGAHLPFWRYASYVVLGSLADLQALDLLAMRLPGAPISPVLVALVGPAAAPDLAHRHPVLVGAFAGLGLITIARWCWTAWAQATATGRPLRAPLLLTAATWLATHLATAAALALARGRSVTP
jgi:hypothetical protein